MTQKTTQTRKEFNNLITMDMILLLSFTVYVTFNVIYKTIVEFQRYTFSV